MKNVNLNQLRLVIREALMEEQEEEAPGAEAAPGGDAKALDSAGGGKEKSDVAKVLAYIQKIDNRGELAQVLMGVIQHAGNVSGSKAVLLKLYKQLPGMIKQMQESKLAPNPKILREALVKESLKRSLKNAIKK